ncbi:inter-alpha-trypsin inhibitor heavy chain H6-like isoform X2 [Heptranchias perlo]|uniref:inter-alpha-trypsin inhibitor heavy chain H6-like isoform X2 n=1 Tax=Heptranchias perlo TaxID=212740 RepID=UPI00355ABC32
MLPAALLAYRAGSTMLRFVAVGILIAACSILQRPNRQAASDTEELVITNLLIRSTVVSRYALTTVHSVVHNPASEAREAVFNMDLPGAAFISNFTLTVDGKDYIAEVKEKEKAKKVYETARRRGQTAAHVESRGRETEKFRVAVNVEARGRVAFTLTHEELLQRRLGKYELALSLRPKQIVQNLTVEVTISERTGIEYVKVLPLRTSNLLNANEIGTQDVPESTTIKRTPTCARVKFSPTPEQQASFSSQGVLGDFVVQYDVRLTDLIGDVQIYNGYFVHFFAPRSLPVLSKNVVFVIDVSGSMSGTKMAQTKEAMRTILGDLKPDDYFNIITFSSSVKVWKPGQLIQASPKNIDKAKTFTEKMVATGGTNINDAVVAGARALRGESNRGDGDRKRVQLIIFLTDGEANEGVVKPSKIVNNAKEATEGTVSLFSLGFGSGSDFPLLRQLSLENRGVARRIYEDADASLQLKGFYDEVASPLLFDVRLEYPGNKVEGVASRAFPAYYKGSELVAAGRLTAQAAGSLRVRLTATGSDRVVSLENEVPLATEGTASGCPGDVGPIAGFVQRLWAYFTIKELLVARLTAEGEAASRMAARALNLSLAYNFVTPLTSLVVVKPDDPAKENKSTAATTPITESTATTIPITESTATTIPITESTATTIPITESTATTIPITAAINGDSTEMELRLHISTKSQVSRLLTPQFGPPGPVSRLLTPQFGPPGPGLAGKHQKSGRRSRPSVVGLAGKHQKSGRRSRPRVVADSEDPENSEEFFQISHSRPKVGSVQPTWLPRSYVSGSLLALKFMVNVQLAQVTKPQTSDGDPHFVVKVPNSNETICFTIDGKPEDVLQLVSDDVSGVTVHGQLAPAPSNVHHPDRARTYFGSIAILVGRPEPRYGVMVTPGGVTVYSGDALDLRWGRSTVVTRPGLRVSVTKRKGVTVTVGTDIEIQVLRHHFHHPTYLQVDHLGLYIVRGDGLSKETQGLLGEFQHGNISIIHRSGLSLRSPTANHSKGTAVTSAELSKGGLTIPVTLVSKASAGPAVKESECWKVAKPDVEMLLQKRYEAYTVPELLHI